MPTFQEFLQKKAKETRNIRYRQQREEWIAALSRLYDQISTWLAESDPDKVLSIGPIKHLSMEPGLGSYDVPALWIGIGEDTVEVVPGGRNSVGHVNVRGEGELKAEGRVDIKRGVQHYILYRTLQDGREKWYVIDDRWQARPLDRARLEEILQDLLA